MLGKLEELKQVMETLQTTKTEIEKKYDQNGEQINSSEYKRIEGQIKEKDDKLKPLSLHIEKLKEELATVDVKDADLVAEYEKQITEALNSEERQNLLKEKEELEKEKENLEKEKAEAARKSSENRLENEKSKKIELLDAENKARATLTQEKIKMEKEVERVKAEMQMQLVKMNTFEYQYEEKDGNRIPTNGMEFKAINDKYNELMAEKSELDVAINYCKEQLDEFRKKDEKEAAEINSILNRKFDKAQGKPGQGKPGQGEPGQGGTGKGGDKKGELDRITISISKDGSQYIIARKDERPMNHKKSEKEPLYNRKGLEEIEKNKLIGDSYVIREIQSAFEKGYLTIEEAREQVQLYEQILQTKSDKERSDIKDKMKLDINYNLKGMRKAGISKEERKELEKNAKQVRDLEIGAVEAPWYTEAKWKIQDLAEKSGINKLLNKAKNILPKREQPKQLREKNEVAAETTAQRPGTLPPEEKYNQQQIQAEVAKKVSKQMKSEHKEQISTQEQTTDQGISK